MAVLKNAKKATRNNGKITKRELLMEQLATLLGEQFEQEVKFTKEGMVLEFNNEKNEQKDFVFKIVEKKDRIKEEDFIE